jgi:DNA-binding response OmpR family regulator
LNVLIVEDNRQMVEVIRAVLSGLGDQRAEFATGIDAGWGRLQAEDFDYVIVDRNLGDGDGVELVRRIRDPKRCRNPYIPILMLTGSGERRVVAAARDAGVSEFLIKPFTVAAMADRLTALINRPRPFIQSPDYFGPDRRRRNDPEYKGAERRKGRAP